MKKYIIGAIFGCMLSLGVGAHAEVTNLIDQVVQGMFPVTVNGQSLGDAIVVDNKTYLPVREFGEAVGYAVTFTDTREVVLTKNVVTPSGQTDLPLPAKTIKINELKKQADDLTQKIVELSPKLSVYEVYGPNHKEPDDEYYALKKQRDDLIIQRDALEEQLDALLAQP